MIIQEPVQATIWFTLNHYAYNDAIFLAERLHAELGSDESLYLLATCYYRAQKQVSAYSILSKQQFKSAECSLLLARCCCDLKKYGEAENILLSRMKGSKFKSFNTKNPMPTTDELVTSFGDTAAFAAQLLGLACSKTDRCEKAAEYYKQSLKLNPFLFTSFEKMIQLGEKPEPTKIFTIANVDFSLCHGNNPLVNLWNTTEKDTENVVPANVVLNHNLQNSQSQNTNSNNNQNNGQLLSTAIIDKHNTFSNQLLNVKDFNQSFEMSSFAVVKSTPDASGIDVLTPDLNNWGTTTTPCQASQKELIAPTIARKLKQQRALSKKINKVFDPPQSRLSFGILELGGDTSPLTNLSIFNMEHTGIKSTSSQPVHSIFTNQTCTPNNVALQAELQQISNSASIAAISNAPVKKPNTRRTQQANAGVASKNLTAKMKLQVHQLNNAHSQDNFGTATPPSSNLQQNLRRSTRLHTGSSVKENATSKSVRAGHKNSKLQGDSKTPSKRIKMTSTDTNTKSVDAPEYQKPEKPTVSSEQIKQAGLKLRRASAEGLLNLLSSLGQAALAVGQFRCQQAIAALESLPRKHYNSAWVLIALGRAYFELGKYDESVKYFEEARQLEPHALAGVEYYSTALWHLQREVKLSMLAHELLEFDKLSPQAWCVAGNCFSLQKEHETAIKFLQRAIQLDSDFAYAYTLLGHELVLTEEMDQAMVCFQNALRIDPRHYNALYGIGMIYYKQEDFKRASIHYTKALKISTNPVLMCHLAVVQHALKQSDQAIETLNKAIAMDPKNALCKFHRASIKFSTDRPKDALKELEELKKIVPKESLIYFLTGKVHKRLGETHLALMNFSWAMDLDPKGANNQIKEVIDKQYANEDEEVVICHLDSTSKIHSMNDSSDAGSSPSVRAQRDSPASAMEDEEDEEDDDRQYDETNELMDEEI